MNRPALVPELCVFDLAASLRFWCRVLGFRVVYDRPEAGFAYLEREGAEIVLCLTNGVWETGPEERPLGRGVNFQVRVLSLAPLLDSLAQDRWPLFLEPHDAWYRVDAMETGNRQLLVQDPDGYLLRFYQDLGMREISSATARG